MIYTHGVQGVRQSELGAEQKHYLLLWQEAARLAKGTEHDPSDIYHALCNLELTPEIGRASGRGRVEI